VRTRLRQLLRLFRFLPLALTWTNRPLQRHRWLFLGLAAALLSVAGLIRLWAAPISAGPDVGQFWGFAKLFEIHALDFYRYADGYDGILPVQGWGYVYPPIWLLLLRLALAAAPGSLAVGDFVDVAWRVAMKAPIITADLAIGCLLLWVVPGSRLRKLFFAAVWLFHPTSWYNSAVFGQFDAIAAVLLLAALIMFVRGRDRPGFILAALAVLTKQHAALPALFMVAVVSRGLPWRRLAANCGIVLGLALALSLPFVLQGTLLPYLRAVLFPAQQPAYQLPLVFTFSGSGAIITYLHENWAWNTEHLLSINSPLLVAATLAALAICYVKRVRIDHAALVGILLFVGLFYRVNYQYLVMYLPLAVFSLSQPQKWVERSLAIALVALPAAWVWLFDLSYWFWGFTPHPPQVPPILARLGLTNYAPDVVFVAMATALMLLSLGYVAAVLARHSGYHRDASTGSRTQGKA
jgi:hypothetical protein